jgi:hypothetical protein
MTARTRRRALAACALTTLAIVVGCMSFSVGGRNEIVSCDADLPPNAASGDLLEQHGRLTLAPGAEQDVYYPVPYVSPPNLTLGPPPLPDGANWGTMSFGDDEVKHFEIVLQRRDRFRVRNTGLFERSVGWRAKGLRLVLVAPAPVVPVAAPPPDVKPERQLPPQPVPFVPSK